MHICLISSYFALLLNTFVHSPGFGKSQWSSKATSGQRLRQATFSHGSTLGLYETLTGKPYLCDIVTDSVVHSFFIERSRILLVQKEKPELEDFLWQVTLRSLLELMICSQLSITFCSDSSQRTPYHKGINSLSEPTMCQVQVTILDQFLHSLTAACLTII